MFAGPVFTREATIAPRRTRTYLSRSACALALLVLASTAWLVLTGAQLVRDVGDMARFGAALFALLAPLQLALALFFSALLAAVGVAQEKDRRTLELLLLTNLRNGELVLGCLGASLLQVLMIWLAAAPVFMLLALFGGVAFEQIGRVQAVTLATIAAGGSLGSAIAQWREKTFPALALTTLALVLWLAVGELLAAGLLGDAAAGVSARTWAVAISPWRAVLAAAQPWVDLDPALPAGATPVGLFLAAALLLAAALNLVAMVRVRDWNMAAHEGQPGAARPAPGDGTPGASPRRSARQRPVWDNPVCWREIRTWAYGRKTLLVRLAYLLLVALAAGRLYAILHGPQAPARVDLALAAAPLFLLSVALINAQAVTAITSERDAGALDLLLATDLTPAEIVFGKLWGALYNTKEMIVAPLALIAWLWLADALSLENACCLVGALLTLMAFAATVGIHCGMHYQRSRRAVAVSLGTLFFLFLGVAVCMRIMIAFSGSFQAQLQPFLAFMLGGGAALYLALGARNPSTAIGLASFLAPLATFYAITSYLLDYPLAVFLATVTAYGFTTAALLIPAVYEFDVAAGRRKDEG